MVGAGCFSDKKKTVPDISVKNLQDRVNASVSFEKDRSADEKQSFSPENNIPSLSIRPCHKSKWVLPYFLEGIGFVSKEKYTCKIQNTFLLVLWNNLTAASSQ